MRSLLICLFLLFASIKMDAQKYILLDKTMSQPAIYTDELSVVEKYNGFFPVETKDTRRFVAVLREIAQTLSAKNISGTAKQYQVGCDKFRGTVIHLASGNRLDYVITAECDNMKVTMHLVDSKLDNENNAYFLNAWISYIENATRAGR